MESGWDIRIKPGQTISLYWENPKDPQDMIEYQITNQYDKDRFIEVPFHNHSGLEVKKLKLETEETMVKKLKLETEETMVVEGHGGGGIQ